MFYRVRTDRGATPPPLAVPLLFIRQVSRLALLLVFGSACPGFAQPAVPQDGAVKAIFEKYDLLGIFAADCRKPAKSVDNWYYVNRLVDANHVRRELMGSPTTVTSVTMIDRASELRPDEIAVAGTREGKPTTGVWRLDKNRMLMVSATFGDQQLIAGGKWVKTGADMPWVSRCD
jgi:hypothetical protein